MGATRKMAEKIATKIETKIYGGIQTRNILKMIFRELRKYRPTIRHQIDLREALSLIKPARDFERFIQILLQEHGYEVTPNQIIRGKCVEHEVDAIARKNGETYIVEVKHHIRYHTRTGLDVSRIARAVFEDVTEGFTLGRNNFKIDRAMIVCNTKFTEHAKSYAKCRDIHHIGWSSPPHNSLQTMIEEKKLYPLTLIKGLNATIKEKLASAGIILIKQLMVKNQTDLRRRTGIRGETLKSIVEKARMIHEIYSSPLTSG